MDQITVLDFRSPCSKPKWSDDVLGINNLVFPIPDSGLLLEQVLTLDHWTCIKTYQEAFPNILDLLRTRISYVQMGCFYVPLFGSSWCKAQELLNVVVFKCSLHQFAAKKKDNHKTSDNQLYRSCLHNFLGWSKNTCIGFGQQIYNQGAVLHVHFHFSRCNRYSLWFSHRSGLY